MKMTDTVSYWGNGKFQAELMPEIYYKFVTELHKNHEDLLRAMTLAQVRLNDWSAFDFLNQFLGTDVKRTDPLELGFARFYDALGMRIKNKSAEIAMDKVARQFENHSIFPTRSDPSKPLFPDEPTQ
jgi:hypothetical protein